MSVENSSKELILQKEMQKAAVDASAYQLFFSVLYA